MSPETHLSQCLGSKVLFSADLTPSIPIPPRSTGKQAWAAESRIHLGSSNPPPTHCGQDPLLSSQYTVHVLLGNSGRKHIAKGGRQWACEIRKTGGN